MVRTPLASVSSTTRDPVELRFPLTVRARWVVAVADAENLVQARVIVREVLAKLADCVSWLHKLSVPETLLVVKG